MGMIPFGERERELCGTLGHFSNCGLQIGKVNKNCVAALAKVQ
jgi:hypothetical protein